MSEKKTFNILSIDGGGIRGIIPAMVLAEIERRVACEEDRGFVPTSELFDLVVGTSTGGILALGLTQNGTCEKPPLSAEELVEIYEKHGSKIFKLSRTGEALAKTEERLKSFKKFDSITEVGFLSILDLISELERLTDEKYSREGLGDVLNCFIDETLCLKDVNTKTMVTCYDMQTPETLFLKSWNCEHKAIKIKDAAFATSAAPTFFEPLRIHIAEKPRTLIDGGIFINSPVVSAYAEGRKIISKKGKSEGFSKEDIFVVSLGTGKSISSAKYEDAKDWGALKWLPELLKYISHSGPAAADYQMKQFLTDDNYVRLQVDELDEEHDEMDDTSNKNICYLKNQAQALINSCEFEKLYEHLQNRVDEV